MKSTAQTAWLVLLTMYCAALLIARIWAAGRSIYLLDEPFYMVTYANPQRHTITMTAASHMVHFFFGWFHPALITYRMIHIALDVLGGVVFFVGFYRWQCACGEAGGNTEKLWTAIPLCLVLIIGNLATGFLYPASVSYYSLNNFLMLCAGSGLLAFMANAGNTEQKIALGVAGFATGMGFLVRFPAGVMLGLTGVAVIGWAKIALAAPWKTTLGRCGIYGGAFVAALGFYFALIQSPGDYRQEFMPLLALLSGGSHSVEPLLKSYVVAALTLINVFVKYGGWILLLWIGMIRLAGRQESNQPVRHFFEWTFLPVWLAVILWGHFYEPMIMYVKVFWLLLVVTAAWWVVFERRTNMPPLWLPGLLLMAALPWLASVGTNLDMTGVMYFVFLPWAGVVVALSADAGKPVFVALLLVFIALHGWFGMVKSPVTFAGQDLLSQTAAVPELPTLRGIRVSPETRAYLLRIQALLDQAGYRRGDTLLGFYRNPGLVYLLGGVPFGNGYYLDGPEFDPENCFYLTHLGTHATLPKAVLLMGTATVLFDDCLKREGVDLQRDYQPVGSITTPPGFYYEAPMTRTLTVLKRR